MRTGSVRTRPAPAITTKCVAFFSLRKSLLNTLDDAVQIRIKRLRVTSYSGDPNGGYQLKTGQIPHGRLIRPAVGKNRGARQPSVSQLSWLECMRLMRPLSPI